MPGVDLSDKTALDSRKADLLVPAKKLADRFSGFVHEHTNDWQYKNGAVTWKDLTWSGEDDVAQYSAINHRTREHLEKFLGEGYESALEIGCGYGRITPLLKQFSDEVVGLDPNQEMLDKLKSHFTEITTVQGKAQELPFEDNSFDLIFTRGVLQHIPDCEIEAVATEIQRVLEEDGVLFIQELTLDKQKYSKHHLYPRTEAEYQQLFNQLDCEYRGFSRKMMEFDFPDNPNEVTRVGKSSIKFRKTSGKD